MNLQLQKVIDLQKYLGAGAILGCAENERLPAFVAERAIQMLRAGVPERWARPFYMLRRFDQVVIGSRGFKYAPINGRVELGYAVLPLYQRQGFATAAVVELLRLAFSREEVDEVLAQINPENVASIKVVQKLGFERGKCFVDEDGEPLVQWIASRKLFKP
jgi:[ribosomal protein S5]-alanine N-acetyltransferase